MTPLQGVGRVVEWLAEVGQQLLDAAGRAVVAFDLASPAVVGGVGRKGVLNLASCPQPLRVGLRLGRSRAGPVDVAPYRAAGIDALCDAHPEEACRQLRAPS